MIPAGMGISRPDGIGDILPRRQGVEDKDVVLMNYLIVLECWRKRGTRTQLINEITL
jgi:hypothetical protein